MRLKRTAATVAATAALTVACTAPASGEGAEPSEPAPSPPTDVQVDLPQMVCLERHYGKVYTCEEANALRLYVTLVWLRWYAFWAAAARYATAAHHARTHASSIANHPWLACIRARESGGNYTIYNTAGSGASGAYQYMPGTWAWMSRQAGYGQWSGGPAASAPPAVQDAVTLWAYNNGHQSHWAATNGGC